MTLKRVIRWKPDLPTKQDEPRVGRSDGEETAVPRTDRYRRRRPSAALFRDEKTHRNGLALRNTSITKAERLERLLRRVALAYGLLTGIGRVARPR